MKKFSDGEKLIINTLLQSEMDKHMQKVHTYGNLMEKISSDSPTKHPQIKEKISKTKSGTGTSLKDIINNSLSKSKEPLTAKSISSSLYKSRGVRGKNKKANFDGSIASVLSIMAKDSLIKRKKIDGVWQYQLK